MEEIKTPTLEKIKAIQRESELFGKFLDWLLQKYTVSIAEERGKR